MCLAWKISKIWLSWSFLALKCEVLPPRWDRQRIASFEPRVPSIVTRVFQLLGFYFVCFWSHRHPLWKVLGAFLVGRTTLSDQRHLVICSKLFYADAWHPSYRFPIGIAWPSCRFALPWSGVDSLAWLVNELHRPADWSHRSAGTVSELSQA